MGAPEPNRGELPFLARVIGKLGEMTNPWILLLSAALGLVAGLFSGLLGRRLEEWWYRPRLKVEFNQNEHGFRTEGRWKEGDTEIVEIYVRARVRNIGWGRVAKQCLPYLVNLEEVHTAGITPTTFVDSFVLRWAGVPQDPNRYNPRDLPIGINRFFDVVGVLKNKAGWRFTFRERFSEHDELPNYAGTYRFTVLVTGDGVVPAGRKIDVTYNRDWHNLRAVDAGPI
jgi:hypothetical protein